MARRLIVVLILLNILLILAIFSLPGSEVKIVFCDVGQGDAALVIWGLSQILIDGGPNDRVIDCLNRHVPFYDKNIEIVVATHPESDHVGGLKFVIDGYSLKYFVSSPVNNQTEGYKSLMNQVSQKKLEVINVYSADQIRLGELSLKIFWPTKEFVDEHTKDGLNSDFGSVLGMNTDNTNLNSFGIAGILTYGNFNVIFTADTDQLVQSDQLNTGMMHEVEVLKVPHHGSKTGMSLEWLEVVSPELAVISSGRGNSYGHPTLEAINMLKMAGAEVKRTDTQGDIVVVSDGKRWRVE